MCALKVCIYIYIYLYLISFMDYGHILRLTHGIEKNHFETLGYPYLSKTTVDSRLDYCSLTIVLPMLLICVTNNPKRKKL